MAAEKHLNREKILSKRRAGVSLPLISLLTQNSFECGDIYSLKVFKDFMEKSSLSIVQILPLNDAGFGRSPYSSISAFAIDPIYISLYMLGIKVKSRSNNIHTIKINHSRVRDLKMHHLLGLFNSLNSDTLTDTLDEFIQNNEWLKSYGAFRILYEKHKGEYWKSWEEGNHYTKELEEQTITKHKERFYFLCWLQYVAFGQLKAIKKEYEDSGIFLKGDMPILTSGNSADIWSRNYLFNMELNCGAPPDYFSEDGQNWGFPTMNWDEVKKEDYKWWRERLSYLENFYHLFRIDHVLGMYRIWSIPANERSGRKGFFTPQIGVSKKEFLEIKLDPNEFVKLGLIYEFQRDKYIFYWDFYKEKGFVDLPDETKKILFPLSEKHLKEDETIWRKMGEEILHFMLDHSEMLPCAEDLGAVPSFVRESLLENEILGLDVVRWTRDFNTGVFFKAEEYREYSVATFSVHDTSIALGWWLESTQSDKAHFLELLELKTEPEKKELLKEIIKFSFSTKSRFSIHLLHDYIFEGKLTEMEDDLNLLEVPNKHRINVPGTTEDKNWGYRFPFHAETLNKETELMNHISEMIKESNR